MNLRTLCVMRSSDAHYPNPWVKLDAENLALELEVHAPQMVSSGLVLHEGEKELEDMSFL